MLQFNDIRVDQRKEPCNRVNINSIKNLVQNCLPYILKVYGSCSTTLALLL